MRRDHRPASIKRLQAEIENAYTNHFIKPQLEHLGPGAMIMKPWYFKPHGAQIYLGEAVHIVTARDRTVRLTTWEFGDHAGHIDVQDYTLLCPGVRIDSASKVTIGRGTMLAASAYVTDADWHDLYDRTQAVGATHPITLEENVWVGDSAVVCKGVTIGENSIIGTGSVVTRSIPANVIAAGNPAQVIRELDPSRELRTRTDLLSEHQKLNREMDQLDRMLRRDNTFARWLGSIFRPRSGH
ncbi:MAG: acyltransferase [Pseudomonadota bacterium]